MLGIDTDLEYFLFACLAFFSLSATVAVVFFERKNPASSLAWVLALLFIPIGGFILYLFLGSGYRVNKRKKYALKAMSDNLYDHYMLDHLDIGEVAAFTRRHKEDARLLTYLENRGEGVLTDNNAVDVFIDGADLFRSMLEDLRQAKRQIHILFYIFRNDPLGREIVTILTEKAKLGVEVRLMYDSFGAMMASDAMFRELRAAGGEVRAFSPIFSNLNSHLRLNYRNHRKIVVVDGMTGYVGGMNVGVEYMGRNPRLSPWRDTHLRLTGSAVWFLQERFIMDWSYASETDPHAINVPSFFPEPVHTGNVGVQIVSSGPDTFESPIKSGLLTMIYGAKKNICLQTPYFAPDSSLFDALRIAAHSNVEVNLMLPLLRDHPMVQSVTLGYARDAINCGINIFLYKGFLHAKTVTVDGRVASIGTANLTNRSFLLDFEVTAFIHDVGFAARHEDIFRRDLENCTRLTPEYFAKQGLRTRAKYNFARLFAPLV